MTVIAAWSRTVSMEEVLRMRISLPIHETVLWNGSSVIFGTKILDHSMAHNDFAEMEVIGLHCGSLPSELHTRGKLHGHVEMACIDA